MSFFNKKKTDNTSSKTLGSTTLLIIFIVVGILLGYLLYLLTKRVLLIFFCPCFMFAMSIYLNPLLLKEEKDKKEGKAKSIYLDFYHDFKEYAYLESSYQEGMRKAIEVMEISELKDKFTDYLESEGENKSLPLTFTQSRTEAQLIDLIYRYLQTEDFSIAELNHMDSYLTEYEKEMRVKKKVLNVSALAFIPMLVYFCLFFISFFPISNG